MPHRLFPLLLALLLAPLPAAAETAYRAVVDAGSSGTRLALYAVGDGGVATLAELAPDGSVGLGRFVGAPEEAAAREIAPLLDGLAAALAAQGLTAEAVPVSVLGTGGLRLLAEEEARPILAAVRGALIEGGHPAGRVDILSGAEEGLYAWIDVNLLAGRLSGGATGAEGGTAAPLGLVEVGGASAQIAFASDAADHPAAIRVRVGKADHTVISVSYLGLGQDRARAAMATRAGSAEAAAVCFPQGQADDAPFATGGQTADGSAIAVPAARAAFGPGCADLYDQTIAATVADAVNAQAPTLADLRALPGYDGTDFVGVSAVYYGYAGWGLLDGDGTVADPAGDPAAALAGALAAHCTGPGAWARVLAVQPSARFAPAACANGAYLHTLLFGADALALLPARLTPTGAIAGQAPSWTRGYALLDAQEEAQE